MSYKIKATTLFNKQLKKLAKKYTSLKTEYEKLLDSLEIDPNQGVPIGKNCYKVRLGIASKGRGKSGGARVITNVFINDETIYLLSIYDKAEKSSLSDDELATLLKQLPQ